MDGTAVGAAPEVVGAIDHGPIDRGQALPLDALDRLLDPTPLATETGWCWLADGVGYVAVRTALPELTGEQVDWWFDWHARDPERYRLWYPPAHFDNRLEPPAVPGAKAHWGATHHPVEDVGTGTAHARIAFVAPTALGFSTDALDDPAVATIVCGFVGDDTRRVTHSVMAHVFLRADPGLVLRSRFWLGAALPRALNHRVARRVALPRKLPAALGRHCAEEYANLGALLPGLYAANA